MSRAAVSSSVRSRFIADRLQLCEPSTGIRRSLADHRADRTLRRRAAHVVAKADLARIETVRLHVAMQAEPPFEPSRLRAAMAAAYATAVGGGAVSALLLTHVP
jgi:hypothetical protein